MYYYGCEALVSAGYEQVTRHNFEKPGKRYLYDYHYSLATPLLGLGANSISYYPGFIYKNLPELDKYQKAVHKDMLPVKSGFDLEANGEEANFYMVKRLTYMKIHKSDFKKRFGTEIEKYYPEQVDALTKAALVEVDSDYFKLTDKGKYYTALVKRCFFNPLLHKRQFDRYGKKSVPDRETQVKASVK